MNEIVILDKCPMILTKDKTFIDDFKEKARLQSKKFSWENISQKYLNLFTNLN